MATPKRSPISPMFGHLPATLPRAIRTGSWLAREARTKAPGSGRIAAARWTIAAALWLIPFTAEAARLHVPYPPLVWPMEITGSQYEPVAWADIAGWNQDDHLQALSAFRAS